MLIDSPGVNDLSSNGVEFSYGYLPFADAALVLLDSTAPVTRTESEFLTDHVIRQVSERIIFVLAKCDRLTPEELEESIDGARTRLRKILGGDSVILPFSMRGSDHDAQLQKVKQQLLSVAERSTASRASLSAQRARQLASEALSECEARIAISSLNPLEKTTALVRIESEKAQLLAKVEQCRDFSDIFGKETLRRLIMQSLATLKENVEVDLMHHVDVATGRIDEFVKKEAPYRIATALRHWSNTKSGEIQVFLVRLADRVSGDCAKAFGSKLQVDHGSTRLDMPSFTVSTESTDSDRMKTMIKDHLLPSALPMLAGYLLLGPLGILAGSFLGRVAEFGVSEHDLSNQRAEARTIIPQQVSVAFSTFEDALNFSIDRWFTELHTLVKTEAERRARDAEDRWHHSQNESHDRLLRAATDLRELVGSPGGVL